MFQGMQYVYAVYREQSFSKAAASLYIGQPSLSATIKKIESKIGFPIFDRSTIPIRPTELGMRYIRTIESIMDVENSFRNYINDVNDLKEGEVVIGGSNLFLSYGLPPLLSRFLEVYPQIHVGLIEASINELTGKLFRGELDLLLSNKQLDPDIYEKKRFHDEQLLLAVPSKLASNQQVSEYAMTAEDIRQGLHKHPYMQPVPLEVFEDEQFLLLRPGNDTRLRADKICHALHLEPKVRLELDQQSTAFNLSCAGLGISFVGDILVKHASDQGQLLYYKLDDADACRNICFYYKRERYLSKAARELLRLIDSFDQAY